MHMRQQSHPHFQHAPSSPVSNWPLFGLCREREGLERSHARAMEAAKAAAADERSAWRAAVTEKVKRQAAQREEQLRALLMAERDGELQQVILRLQQEQAAALEDAKQQVSES